MLIYCHSLLVLTNPSPRFSCETDQLHIQKNDMISTVYRLWFAILIEIPSY